MPPFGAISITSHGTKVLMWGARGRHGGDVCTWPLVHVWPKFNRDIPAPLYVKGLFFRQIKIHVWSRSGLKKT
jgi:hypothetical protein